MVPQEKTFFLFSRGIGYRLFAIGWLRVVCRCAGIPAGADSPIALLLGEGEARGARPHSGCEPSASGAQGPAGDRAAAAGWHGDRGSHVSGQ